MSTKRRWSAQFAREITLKDGTTLATLADAVQCELATP
jgi:hypothetical protein